MIELFVRVGVSANDKSIPYTFHPEIKDLRIRITDVYTKKAPAQTIICVW